MTKTNTKLSRNAKRVTARRRAQKEQQKKRSGSYGNMNQILAGQSNPLRREPGGFLTDSQRQQLQKAGRDIHGELLPYVKDHTFELPKDGMVKIDAMSSVSLENFQTVWEEEQMKAYDAQTDAELHDRDMDTKYVEMTAREHAELVELARSRKRGFQKVAQKEGWLLLHGMSHKSPANWYKEV